MWGIRLIAPAVPKFPPQDFLYIHTAMLTLSHALATVFDDWIQQIHAEPCVLERNQTVDALLESPRKLRKGMEPR